MQKNLDEINLHSGALAKFLKLEANVDGMTSGGLRVQIYQIT